LQAPQDRAVLAYEGDFFRQVAELWNERAGNWRQFPEFLNLVYDRRIVRPAETIEEAATTGAVTLPFPGGIQRVRRAA
jgi:hypothetical protein